MCREMAAVSGDYEKGGLDWTWKSVPHWNML
jgi:hypothetical protein